ncbi:MAG: hypothetical protein MI749_03480, partial [Desulfovibrionales bacterium]|nr:hypothetical protein [Desulfovibrionales bacterium]
MKPTIGSLFLILLILIGTSNAHEITSKVFCAGFAFIGEYKDIQHQYKYSNKIYDLKNSNGDLLVEQELKKRIAKIQCKELQIISNNIEDLNTGEGLSMAIALDWEDVATEKLE